MSRSKRKTKELEKANRVPLEKKATAHEGARRSLAVDNGKYYYCVCERRVALSMEQWKCLSEMRNLVVPQKYAWADLLDCASVKVSDIKDCIKNGKSLWLYVLVRERAAAKPAIDNGASVRDLCMCAMMKRCIDIPGMSDELSRKQPRFIFIKHGMEAMVRIGRRLHQVVLINEQSILKKVRFED